MKKYLMTGIAAVAMCAAFTSCSKDLGFEQMTPEEAVQASYETAFIKAFGQPAPDQDWGFGSRSNTRTAHTNNNQWFDPNYYGLEKPADLFPEEIEYVMNWFSQEREGHGETLDLNDYFVQQVGYGNKDDQGVTYNPSGQVWEKYENGQHVYRTENYSVNSKEHMDWIAANMTSNVQSEDDCDHINNFNTSSGSLMLMKDSETKYGFAFKDSWGTTNNLVSTNYYMVHLVADYKGKHIDGWYVGFDYQTYKSKTEEKSYTVQLDHDPWYEWRTETITTENVYQAPDGRYNDRVVKIVPAGSTVTPPTPPVIPPTGYQGRIMAEDLTVRPNGSASDFDFNDVVFDWKIEGKVATIQLRAIGGTLPLYVGGVEVHGKFGARINQMVNTGVDTMDEPEAYTYTFPEGVTAIPENIPIVVTRSTGDVELKAERGKVASKINVPTTTKWVKEYQDIENAYPQFKDWVSDPSVNWTSNYNTAYIY